jgi:hypothetical protein
VAAHNSSRSLISIQSGPKGASAPSPEPQRILFVPQIRWSVSLFVFVAGVACGAALCVCTIWFFVQFTSK